MDQVILLTHDIEDSFQHNEKAGVVFLDVPWKSTTQYYFCDRRHHSSERRPDPYAGVAILMSPRIARSVLHSGCCGARIVFVRIKASPCNLFVVSVYVPHSGRQAPSASDTLADLEALLSKVHQHDCVVLLGNSNAKLARHTDGMTGRRANPVGDRLLGLMDRLQLCAVSTLHQPRRCSTNATYLSKDPRYGPSQIVFVMVSCRWATSAHKCCVKWG